MILAQFNTHSHHQTNCETKLDKQRRENDARTIRSDKNGRDADWQGDGGSTIWLTATHTEPTGLQTSMTAPLYNSTRKRPKIQGKKAVFQCPSLQQGTILRLRHVTSVLYWAHEMSTSSGAVKYSWKGFVVDFEVLIFASCLIWKKLVFHFYPQITNNMLYVLYHRTQINLGGAQRSPKTITSVFLSLKLRSLELLSKKFKSDLGENESAFFRGTWLSSAGPTRLICLSPPPHVA